MMSLFTGQKKKKNPNDLQHCASRDSRLPWIPAFAERDAFQVCHVAGNNLSACKGTHNHISSSASLIGSAVRPSHFLLPWLLTLQLEKYISTTPPQSDSGDSLPSSPCFLADFFPTFFTMMMKTVLLLCFVMLVMFSVQGQSYFAVFAVQCVI